MSGRRPKVSWQKSQNAGKIQNRRQAGWSLALCVLYATALGVLLLYATFRMAEDCFGVLYNAEEPGCLWVAVLAIPITLAWNEALHVLERPRLRLAGSLALLLAAPLGFWYYYRDQTEELVRGFYGLGQRYLDAWNSYFLTTQEINPALRGSAAEQQLAWGLLLPATAVFLQILSALLRKRSVLLLLPVTVLAAEMMVGLTPKWPGMACMFAAGMLGLYLDCHREFQAVPALVLAGLLAVLLPLTAAVLKEPASRVSLAHDRLQAFQHRMEQEIRDYDWQALFEFHRDGQLDNQKLEYEYKEILTVTVSTLPAENLYLRGYYGTEYQKGAWNPKEKEFDRACRRYGIGSGEAALLLAELNSPDRTFASADRVQYKLRYTGQSSNCAYLPYGADLETAQDPCQISGDYLVKKARSLDSLGVEGYAPGSLVLHDAAMWNSDAQSFYSWYNEYVSAHYLEVPEELTELTRIVNSIESSDTCRTIQEGLTNGNAAGRNEARLRLGNLVARELQSLARYNIDPGSLPRGMDPVEYFLGENRQGYCMHFATAGALILRQLGVPARYVSGYVVEPGQFRQMAGGYRASVKDDAAHAWVEIWLEQVGWVPVEMTPGYGEAVAAMATQNQQNLHQSAQEQDQSEPDERKEQASPESMDQQVTAASPVPSPQPQNQPQEGELGLEEPGIAGLGAFASALGSSDKPDGQDLPEGWGFAGEGGWAVFGQNGNLRVGHVVLALSGILAAAGLIWLAAALLMRRRDAWWG
ncbi:MAG: transglutaminase-like domain-containing protein, partial [Acetatifactor sp.]|nr:transglutaminase-like domain-containing protein [Acetatifactor sp.]